MPKNLDGILKKKKALEKPKNINKKIKKKKEKERKKEGYIGLLGNDAASEQKHAKIKVGLWPKSLKKEVRKEISTQTGQN